MAEQKNVNDFSYDPEAEENTKKYRLPFALCKAHGIAIQDWWTPKDAWAALERGGQINDVSEEYKKYYRDLKKEQSKLNRERNKERNQKKKEQLKDPRHNPDYSYEHQKGFIAGAKKGEPMTFEQADNGNVNPWYGKDKIGYRHNCQTCVATYFARRMGYDVSALPNLNNEKIAKLSRNTSLAYMDKDGNPPKHNSKPKGVGVSNWLNNSIKNGEIHTIEFGYGQSRRGHIIIAEKDSAGELKLYDPQINQVYTKKEIQGYFVGKTGCKTMNLSNCTLNEKYCDGIMKDKEKTK